MEFFGTATKDATKDTTERLDHVAPNQYVKSSDQQKCEQTRPSHRMGSLTRGRASVVPTVCRYDSLSSVKAFSAKVKCTCNSTSKNAGLLRAILSTLILSSRECNKNSLCTSGKCEQLSNAHPQRQQVSLVTVGVMLA